MRISDWSSDVCSSDLGYRGEGNLCGVYVGVYLKRGIFRDSYKIFVSANGFEVGRSDGTKRIFERAESIYNNDLSSSKERAIEWARSH